VRRPAAPRVKVRGAPAPGASGSHDRLSGPWPMENLGFSILPPAFAARSASTAQSAHVK
jgi:hypothetical protein